MRTAAHPLSGTPIPPADLPEYIRTEIGRGKTLSGIAADLKTTRQTVRKWLGREIEIRQGRPRTRKRKGKPCTLDYTLPKARKYLRDRGVTIGKNRMARLVETSALRCHRIGGDRGRRYIDRDDLDKFIQTETLKQRERERLEAARNLAQQRPCPAETQHP